MDLASLPATRKEAQRVGATHYFTGKPCKHGHISARLTKGTCMVCREIEWKDNNDKRKGKPKSEAAKLAGRRYYERNKNLVKRRAKARTVEDQRKARKKWKEKNAEKVQIDSNTRRRRLRERTPKWLTKKDKSEILAIYEKAAKWTKETGTSYVVDHILPLRGDTVSGLHVPTNLQVVTRSDNAKKSNKH